MSKQSLLNLALVFGSLLSSPAWARKSFDFRGQRVELRQADDVMLVRAKGPIKALDLAGAALEAQAKLLGKNVGPAGLHFAKTPPLPIRLLGGVLAPRLPGVKDGDLSRLAALGEGIAACEPVYRVEEQLAVPTGTITVRLQRPLQPRLLFALAEELGLKEVARPRYAPNLIRFQPTAAGADPIALAEKLSQRNFVRWAEPDLVVQLLSCGPRIPNDPFFQQQWHLQPGESAIQAPEAWGESLGSDQITVAVLDDGVDLRHRDLAPKLVAGYDFFQNDSDPQPDPKDAHGTACAGLIGGLGDNGEGIAGIAWNAKIMPIRISGEEGFAANAAIGDAIHYAVQHGAKILSCSWGGKAPSNQIIDAIDTANDAGCLVFVAAGNATPALHTFYPARYEGCIAVGAIKRDNLLWDYSCYGPGRAVDLVAPSGACNLEGDIWSTDQSGDRGYNSGGGAAEEASGDYTAHFGGTSAATPIAAGVAALVWSSYPKLTALQVRQILEETASQVDPNGGEWINGRSVRYGCGKVNALAAIQKAKQVAEGVSPPSEPTPVPIPGPAPGPSPGPIPEDQRSRYMKNK